MTSTPDWFDTNPEREAVSRSANLSRELLYAVNRILVEYLRLFSGILRVRLLALKSDPNYTRAQEHMVLKNLTMESGLR